MAASISKEHSGISVAMTSTIEAAGKAGIKLEKESQKKTGAVTDSKVAQSAAGALAAAGSASSSAAACGAAAAVKPKKKKTAKFTVSMYPQVEKDLKVLGELAANWQEKATQLRIADKKPANIVDDSRIINKLIKQCLFNREACVNEFHIFDTIFICRHRTKAIEGIVLTLDHLLMAKNPVKVLGKYLKITHLGVNPDNLKLSDSKPDRIAGAGTAMISAMAKRCLSGKFTGLYTESTESAKAFYEKLGFVVITENVVVSEIGTVPMYLTTARIRELAAQKKAPYCSFANDFK